MAYSAELRLALRAVHRAALVTKSVLRSLSNNVSAETKADDSPVTIADFAAQALLISTLQAVYPNDRFLGEESADALRQDEQLADRVWQLVQQAKDEAHAAPNGTGNEEEAQKHMEGEAQLVFPATKEDMFDLIDRGGKGQDTGRGRVWVMDPVDGTATFMQVKKIVQSCCFTHPNPPPLFFSLRDYKLTNPSSIPKGRVSSTPFVCVCSSMGYSRLA